MTDTNNREALLKATTMVRPALATRDYIPALMHIRFDGRMATTYNDVAGLGVRCGLELDCCLPGELFIKALSSFKGESIALAEGKSGAIVVSSGRSKVTLPTLQKSKFPLEMPTGKHHELPLDAGLLKGLAAMLPFVGIDPTHPATMGVTVDVDADGCAVLFTTDNYTISRYGTDSKIELPGDAPIILPTFLCEQVLRMASAFPDAEGALLIYSGVIVAEFGNDLAWALQKTLVDLEPLDFPRILKKHCDLDALRKAAQEIPAGFDDGLERALLVLSQEVDKVTAITWTNGLFRIASSSQFGDSEDRYKWDGADFEPFSVDPALVARGSKVAAKMAFFEKVLVMADDKLDFVHVISHVSKSK